MSWFEEEIVKYEPQWVIAEPAPVLQYGLLEDLLDEDDEVELEFDAVKFLELTHGSASIT